MPEQLLHDAQICPAIEQMRGKAVTQGVRRDTERQPGPLAQSIQSIAQAAHAQ